MFYIYENQLIMRKTILVLLTMGFFLGSCVDKKAEEQKKTEALNKKIEVLDKEINEEVESLEKAAKEIENALNELDNI
jgi:hypothetical protein